MTRDSSGRSAGWQAGRPVTSFQGTAQAFQASLQIEPCLIAAAIIAVYIVLGILYESYIHPITILRPCRRPGSGALLALMLVGHDLSIIGLIGIILLDRHRQEERDHDDRLCAGGRARQGLAPEQAIYQACRLRFRPIMMTTMAALLGALAAGLRHGRRCGASSPLGVTIVGGLLVSQVLTLYTTPVIYLYLGRLRFAFSRRAGGLPVNSELQAKAASAGSRPHR